MTQATATVWTLFAIGSRYGRQDMSIVRAEYFRINGAHSQAPLSTWTEPKPSRFYAKRIGYTTNTVYLTPRTVKNDGVYVLRIDG